MNMRVLSFFVCLLFLPGCYVHTQVEVQGGALPPDLSGQTLVVTVRDAQGLTESQVGELEQTAVQALSTRRIRGISLNEASGGQPGDAKDILKQRGYRTLFAIAVTSWGSKLQTLFTSASPSIGTPDTDTDTSFYKPGSIDQSEYSGPTTSYKEVGLKVSLVDLQGDHLVWSGECTSSPGIVGRSFLYKHFNGSLRYEELARDCLEKLAKELPRP
jgi:hypothetical protein